MLLVIIAYAIAAAQRPEPAALAEIGEDVLQWTRAGPCSAEIPVLIQALRGLRRASVDVPSTLSRSCG